MTMFESAYHKRVQLAVNNRWVCHAATCPGDYADVSRRLVTPTNVHADGGHDELQIN